MPIPRAQARVCAEVSGRLLGRHEAVTAVKMVDMSASQPTILATSVGFHSDGPDVWNFRPGHAYSLAARLSGASRHPRLCIIGTAVGDLLRLV